MCRESYTMCRIKNPIVAFNLQNQCIQCAPAHYPREILRIRTLTEGPLYRENNHLCRLKNPTVVYMIVCRVSFCKTVVYHVCRLIIFERGCSSMYRKKDSIGHMLKSRYYLYPCFNTYNQGIYIKQSQTIINNTSVLIIFYLQVCVCVGGGVSWVGGG